MFKKSPTNKKKNINNDSDNENNQKFDLNDGDLAESYMQDENVIKKPN